MIRTLTLDVFSMITCVGWAVHLPDRRLLLTARYDILHCPGRCTLFCTCRQFFSHSSGVFAPSPGLRKTRKNAPPENCKSRTNRANPVIQTEQRFISSWMTIGLCHSSPRQAGVRGHENLTRSVKTFTKHTGFFNYHKTGIFLLAVDIKQWLIQSDTITRHLAGQTLIK